MAERIWCLQKIRLFEQLPAADIEFLEAHSRSRTFPRNTPVYFPEDAADCVFVLVEGRIRLSSITSDGKEGILALIEPGELFGELAILGSDVREEHARCVENSKVVSIRREAIESVLLRNAHLSLSITRLMGLRRQRIERRLRHLLFRSSRERLAGLLCELAEQYGRKVSDGILIDIRLSHQDLAGLVGTSRESATLTLGELRREHLIRVESRRFVVLRADLLSVEAGEVPRRKRPTGQGVRGIGHAGSW